MRWPRSWLFAPGHDEKLLGKVSNAGADVVLLDLEDAVPPNLKNRARDLVADFAQSHRCWVRVNKATTPECERDIAALAGLVDGIRLPKVDGPEDIVWASQRAPHTLLDCTIESARGALAVAEIAKNPACYSLSYGGVDMAQDLRSSGGQMETLFVRSYLVVACRAAGKPPPSDGVHTLIGDDEGLRIEADAARRLGFFGKSAIHPRQVPIINAVFTPSAEEREWAHRVLSAFEAAGGAATKLPDGAFIDKAVAERARQVLSWN